VTTTPKKYQAASGAEDATCRKDQIESQHYAIRCTPRNARARGKPCRSGDAFGFGQLHSTEKRLACPHRKFARWEWNPNIRT
jgi:hypothetical protein